jgi:hypothetical protein
MNAVFICDGTAARVAQRRASKLTAENAVRQLCRAAADISNSLQYGISRTG